MRNCIYCIFLITGIYVNRNVSATDTLIIGHNHLEKKLYNYFQVFEDTDNNIDIAEIIDSEKNIEFIKSESATLNFGFSTSTIWLKIIVKNNSDSHFPAILEVANPDLDYINFYIVKDSIITKEITTGELLNIKSRDIYNRNFLLSIDFEPGEVKTVYISSINGGHAIFFPIRFNEETDYYFYNTRYSIFTWLIYGLLIFILLFNSYLYLITKEKINLHYSLYLFFAFVFFLTYQGYHFAINPPVFLEKIKWINPALYIVFLLSFTQAFISNNNKIKKKRNQVLNSLKIIAIVCVFFYPLPYPFSLVADIGLPVLILLSHLIIIALASMVFNRKNSPSVLFLVAYSVVFLSMVLHEFKEIALLPANIFTETVIILGVTLESIILTIAVLELFRINQAKANLTIERNLKLIENQNKELEIINTELEKLSIVASETTNSVAIYDSSGRIEWCNSEFEKFYDVSHGELIKEKTDRIEKIIPNKDIKDLFRKCSETGKPLIFETYLKTRRNKELWVQTTLSPFKRSNSIYKIIAIDADISELKIYERNLTQAKEKAEESDRLKSSFLANMSHEIRTPLNGIIGFGELLELTSGDEEKKKHYIQIIRNNGEQLTRIIEDIMDISLIESNQLRFNLEKFSFNDLIAEIIDFFGPYRSTIGKDNIEIIKVNDLENKNNTICSDPHRIKQVIINLLKNALKFTKEGSVKLGSFIENDELLVYIEDTGIGVDNSIRDIIFERFRQGEETLTRKYGGTGLGLAISKGIIDMLGGRIWLDKGYDNGSRFCFTIPMSKLCDDPDSVDDRSEKTIDLKRLSNKKILVVEDHETSFNYLKEILTPFKMNITRAISGQEAIEYIEREKFDIILMDISLPEVDGISATREIRKIHKELPIIAQTAHAMLAERDRIMSSGCTDFISKPINSRALLEKMERNLKSAVN